MLALAVALSVGAGAGAGRASSGGTVSFASGPQWATFDASGDTPSLLGPAQRVCMNAYSPPTCPEGATDLGAPFSGWAADLTAIPGASWIWAPGVDGASVGAALAEYVFVQVITLRGRPADGSFSIAADDFAEIWVNGHRVGSVGSAVDAAQAGAHNALTTFEITGKLRSGLNIFMVKAQNGPAAFSPYCSAVCTYAQNPAGVVFGGTVILR